MSATLTAGAANGGVTPYAQVKICRAEERRFADRKGFAMTGDRNKPSSRKLGRAGVMVAAIVLAVIVLVFAGRNIWHAEQLEQEQRTGVKERSGLN
ncbi:MULTISPECIES: hypothetical protein [Novosphingobium]|uniref:hypothetical protein n=1 Tax=Novosphingobium sp. TCA1 TaxID=2682474 RepID=UPI00117D99E4|nr:MULTISPECIES: hypothetical protein [Novosphingobium]GFE76592.1 hypothetical protein NTCA1_42410 [Novosphingobium sp. TCA1]